jgi:hypothetical protein
MKHFFPFACVTAVLLQGCSGDQTAENAVARIQQRKTPGYARVVNLTSGDILIWHKARPISKTTQSMEASDLVPIGTGEQTLRLESGSASDSKKLEVKATLTPDQGSSIILMPDRTTKIIEHEHRYATDESNVHIVPVEAGGKLPTSASFSGADNKALPVKDSLVLLNQGRITCPDGSTIEIKDHIAYSLFIVATPSKVYYILGKNASDAKPQAVGAAAA